MATGRKSAPPITHATATPFSYAPESGASEAILAEFWEPGDDDVLIGTVSRTHERQDPLDKTGEKLMRSLTFAPVLIVDAANDGERTAYGSMAVGFSAHLALLLPSYDKLVGKSFAIQYNGTRASGAGKNPSKQYRVWELSAKALNAEFAKLPDERAQLDDDTAPLPF